MAFHQELWQGAYLLCLSQVFSSWRSVTHKVQNLRLLRQVRPSPQNSATFAKVSCTASFIALEKLRKLSVR